MTDDQEPQMPPDAAMAGAAPTMPSGAPKPSGGLEVPVPIDALAMPGVDDKLNNPEVGDPVQMQAEGTVTRIEGGMAFVSVKSVNGKPVDAEGAKTTDTTPVEDDGSGELAQLRTEATAMPNRE